MNVLAASMAKAAPGDLVALAASMATLARELEARRLANADNVVTLASRRGQR